MHDYILTYIHIYIIYINIYIIYITYIVHISVLDYFECYNTFIFKTL